MNHDPDSLSYRRKHHRPHVDFMMSVSICLYCLLLAYWAIDVAILHQELLVLLPNELSSPPSADIIQALDQSRVREKYAQVILQIVIVSFICRRWNSLPHAPTVVYWRLRGSMEGVRSLWPRTRTLAGDIDGIFAPCRVQ